MLVVLGIYVGEGPLDGVRQVEHLQQLNEEKGVIAIVPELFLLAWFRAWSHFRCLRLNRMLRSFARRQMVFSSDSPSSAGKI